MIISQHDEEQFRKVEAKAAGRAIVICRGTKDGRYSQARHDQVAVELAMHMTGEFVEETDSG